MKNINCDKKDMVKIKDSKRMKWYMKERDNENEKEKKWGSDMIEWANENGRERKKMKWQKRVTMKEKEKIITWHMRQNENEKKIVTCK